MAAVCRAGGAQRILKLDLMITTSSATYDDHWYVEVDLGNESLPVLLRKCTAYDDYRRTGRAQAEHGIFPQVLWVLPSLVRVARLQSAIATASALSSRMFVCTAGDPLIETLHNPPTG